MSLCDVEDVRLDTFVDVRKYAYVAVSYLVVRLGERVTVSLVATKYKAASLKPPSIPRLELQKPLIGVSGKFNEKCPSLANILKILVVRF